MITDRVKQIIASKSLNVTQFAKSINVSQTTLNSQLIRKRSLSLDVISAILSTFEDISAEWLLRGVGNMYVIDNLPLLSGTENDNELSLHAEIARHAAHIEELQSENIKLLHQLEFMENLNFKLTGRCHELEKKLSETHVSASKVS